MKGVTSGRSAGASHQTEPRGACGPESAATAAGVTAMFISHACVLLRAGPVGLLSDPWLEGEIFNSSWAPLFTGHLGEEELAALTHIWISHEHPDHLHFPSLRSIPPEVRARVTLLYQRHPQRAVVDALRQQGFREVIEMKPARWYVLAPGVEAACFPSRRVDSALAFRAAGTTILNLNDCKIGDWYLRHIGRVVGPVTLLLGQYSIAGWIGNPGQAAPPKRWKVIERTTRYCRLLRPRALGLFASHAWFCHEENSYMNEWAISPQEAVDFVASHGRNGMLCHALLPLDRWSVEGFVSRGENLSAWGRATLQRATIPPVARELVPLATLMEVAIQYLDQLRCECQRTGPPPGEPLDFYVEDLNVTLRLVLSDFSLQEHPTALQNCHLSLGSQALWNSFRYRWGFDTLDTSGRYKLINGPKKHPALVYLYDYGAANNQPSPFGLWERILLTFARRWEWLDARKGAGSQQ